MRPKSTNREYKDRLFKAIFGRDTEESKRWRLDLYNALNDSNYTDPDELQLNTIENVIYITMHNDVSFLIDDQICLYEQQSSMNQNMPLRGLLYFSQLYQKYLAENKKDPNRGGMIMIPTPKFIVFYNGLGETPDEFEMHLSDAFKSPDKSGNYEWTVYVKNINENHCQTLQKNCKALYDYSRFVAMVRENAQIGFSDSDAIERAVDEAIKGNLLDGFFRRQKAEVIGMILEEFDEELYKQNVREDGYLEGVTDGQRQKALEDAENLLREGDSVEKVARCIGLPLEQVRQIAESISVKM
ncbi:MAG: hypothetical protein IKR40_10375 [Treponema sp.]|nr:hypothetical protein [Treponema sp.]